MKFVKDRFNGNAPKRTSYEQNEKRTRDLVHLSSENTIHLSEQYLQETEVYSPIDQEFLDEDEDNEANWNEVYEDISENKNPVRSSDVYKNSKEDPRDDIIIFIGKNVEHSSYNEYEFLYPKNMMYVLNEDVIISD